MPVIKVCGRFVSYGDGKWPQDLIMVVGSSARRLVGSSARRIIGAACADVQGVQGVQGVPGCAGCAGRRIGAERLVTGRSGGTSDLDRADGDHCMGTREGPGDR